MKNMVSKSMLTYYGEHIWSNSFQFVESGNCEVYGGTSMNIVLFTDNIDEYLKEDTVINYGNENIMQQYH